MNYYDRAMALRTELVENRRYLHANAEVGLDMPKARAYIMKKLKEYGIDPMPCGKAGITATIGHGGKVLLLRADMDALPMREESGLDYACPTGDKAHACGHDFHAAMLLTAAKLLKEDEGHLKGTVKLMFQPGEETFQGAQDMINGGILENPVPDAALAFHIGSGQIPPEAPEFLFMYNDTGVMMASMDEFSITVQGKGGHGGFPHMSIDPINIGVHIHLALQELIARESDPGNACVLTIGQFSSGSAPNIIPERAFLQGTIRCNHPEAREKLVRRMKQVAEQVAGVFGGTAQVDMPKRVPTLTCDKEIIQAMVSYIKELPLSGLTGVSGISASGSEDFALIAEQIPSAYIFLQAGFPDERGAYPQHHPKVQFNENALPFGAACMAHCARRWLEG